MVGAEEGGGDLAERGGEGGREKEVGELRRVALEVGEKESIVPFFLMFQRQGAWKAVCVLLQYVGDCC